MQPHKENYVAKPHGNPIEKSHKDKCASKSMKSHKGYARKGSRVHSQEKKAEEP